MEAINSRLISQFKRFLLEKQEETGIEYNTDSASIYQYTQEFEEFIEEKYFEEGSSIFNSGFNLENLDKLKIGENGFETSKYSKSDEAEFFAEILNNLMESEEFKGVFDADKNGEISKDEYGLLLQTMNSDENEKISIDEFMQTLTSIQNNELSIMDITSYADESANGSNNNSNSNSSSNPRSIEKTPENMSLAELSTTLDTAKATTDEKEIALNNAINDNTQDLIDKKSTMNDSFKTFNDYLKENDENLAGNLEAKKQEVSQKESELNATESAINTQKNVLLDATGAFDSANSRLNELKSAKANLETELKSLTPEDQSKAAKIKEKISQAEADIIAQEKIIKDEEAKKQAAQEELNRLENEVKPAQVQALETAKQELSAFEAKAKEIALTQNEDGTIKDENLANSWNNYESAKTDYETSKTQAKESAQAEFDKSLSEQEKLQKTIAEKQIKDVLNKYSIKGLNLSYTFKDGTVYDVVGIEGFDSLEAFTQQVYDTGLTNLGQYGTMQCFKYSFVMSDLILGRATEELTQAFITKDGHQAGFMGQHKEWNFRDYHKAKSGEDGKNGYDIVANELAQGRPCVVGMNSSHYGLCVGMRSGAEPPYQESDFLIIDSYNAQIEQGGNTNYFNKNQSIYVLTDGWRYENGHGAFTYEFT
ncbi:MAG: hypothetical protein IJW73_00345 [Candidatus Gastranaerophilales bacterium]|nr:hypothetical protein [Candidatus Gastranaerophilales bacterium]